MRKGRLLTAQERAGLQRQGLCSLGQESQFGRDLGAISAHVPMRSSRSHLSSLAASSPNAQG